MTDIAELAFRVDTSDIERATRALQALTKQGTSFSDAARLSSNAAATSFKEVASSAAGVQNGAKQASTGLNSVSEAAKKADSSTSSLNEQSKKLTTGFNDIKLKAVALAASVGATIGSYLKMSEQYRTMTSQLELFSESTEEADAAQVGLMAAARSSLVPLKEVSGLYTAILPTMRDMGYEQAEVLRVTELSATAMQLAGGNAAGHAAAMLQLTQALGSGVLRGDEFNSIMENGRGLAYYLAEGLQVPIGALREMAQEGELTGDIVVEALLSQGDEIERAWASYPVSIGAAWSQIQNAVLIAVGEMESVLGVGESISNMMLDVADGIYEGFDSVIDILLDVQAEWVSFKLSLQISDDAPYRILRSIGEAIEEIGDAIAPAMPYIGQFAGALATITAGYGGYVLAAGAITQIGVAVAFLGKAILAHPIAASIAAIGAAAYVVYDNWDGISEWWSGIWKSITDTIDAFMQKWDAFIDKIVGIKDSVGDIFGSVKDSVGDAVEDMAEGGENVVVGFWNGIMSKLGLIDEASEELAETPINTTEEVLDMHSPSKVMENLGKLTGDGFAAGILNSTKDVQEASGLMSMVAQKEFAEIAKALLEQRLELTGTAEEVQRYELGVKSITGAAADWIVETTATNNALEKQKEVSERVNGVIADLKLEHAALKVELQDGAAAAEVMKHRAEGYSQSQAVLAAELKISNEEMREQIRMNEQVARTMKGFAEEQEKARIELTLGEEAARRYELGLKGLDAAQIDVVMSGEKQIESMRKQAELREELSDGIQSAIVDADSVKDAFSNLGDFMRDWLETKIREFAANQVTVFLGLNGDGMESGFSGVISNVSKMLGGFGDTMSGLFGGVGQSLTGMLGSVGNTLGNLGTTVGNAIGGLFGASSSAATSVGSLSNAVNAAAGGMNSATAAMGSTTAGLSTLAGALGAGGLGYAVGELAGAANSAAVGVLSAVGSLVGGPLGAGLGAAIGSAFGSSWEHIESGLELAFQEGDLTGKSFKYFEKERSMWRGTATKIVYEELNGEIAKGLSDFMTGLGDTITTLGGQLGIDGAEEIMSSFSVATQRLQGDDIEEQLTGYMNRVSLGAYRAIYNELGPQMQAAVDGVVDMTVGSVERLVAADPGGMFGGIMQQINTEIANAANDEEVAAALEKIKATFAEIAIVTYDLVPVFETLGIQMGETADEVNANAFEFAESVGGASNAVALMTGFMNDFAPAGTVAAAQLDAARQNLDEWNASMGRGDNAVELLRGKLDSLGESGSLVGLALDSFVTVVDESTGAIHVNESALEAWLAKLDRTNPVVADAAAAGESLLEIYRMQGEGAITTSEQMYEYALSLDWTTEAGREAGLAAIAVADSLKLVEEENERLASNLESVQGIYEKLNIELDETSPLTIEATEALIELAGGMDQLRSATNQYYEEFYSAEERQRLELQLATSAVEAWHATLTPLQLELAGITDGSVDTREEFRMLGDYLLSTGAAGHEAFVAMLNVQDSFLTMIETNEELGSSMSTMADDLKDTFAQMREDAEGATDGLTVAVIDSLAGIVAEAQESGPEMHRVLAASFDEVLADAGLTAEQLPQPLQDAYNTMIASSEMANTSLSVAAGETANQLGAMKDSWNSYMAEMIENSDGSGRAMLMKLDESFTEMVSNAEASGGKLNEEMLKSFNQLLADAGMTADDLPPTLREGFEQMLQDAADTNTALQGSSDEMSRLLDSMRLSWDTNLDSIVASADHGGDEMERYLQASFDQLVNETRDSSQAVRDAAVSRFKQMLTQVGITADELPPALKRGLDSMVSKAEEASRKFSNMTFSTGSWGAGWQAYFDSKDGSHAGGLGSVPFDGYRAELHKNEMVMPANVANWLRQNGVQPAVAANSAPDVPRANSSNENIVALEAIRQEIAELRRDNEKAARNAEYALNSIASGTQQQTVTLRSVEKGNDRLSRKITAAIS